MKKKELISKLREITNMDELKALIEEIDSMSFTPGEPMPEALKLKIGASTGHKVECVETGKIYNSVGHAAKDLGIKYCQSVWQAANKGGTANGYHFKYVV